MTTRIIPRPYQNKTIPDTFKSLLAQSRRRITSLDPTVCLRLKQYFSDQIGFLCETPDEALHLYEQAEIIPNPDTIDKIENELGICIQGEIITLKNQVVVMKALSSIGQPVVAKIFFNAKHKADYEANIGQQLSENGIFGFVIPEMMGHVHRHTVLKMPMHSMCLQEFSMFHSLTGVRLPMSSELVLKLAQQIKNSLDDMHQKLNLYHCDIKPGNILISSKSEALICDLGSVCGPGEFLKSSYNLPQDQRDKGASKKIDYLLLATTVLEMLGNNVSSKNLEDIHEYVRNCEQSVKSFLEILLE